MFGLDVSPRLVGWAALAIVAALAVGHYWSLSNTVDRLEAQKAVLVKDRKDAISASERNRAALAAERNRARAVLNAAIRERDAARRRADQIEEIKDETRDNEDGPLAPVLRNALDRLLGFDARANGADGGKAGGAKGSGANAGMPRNAVPAKRP